MKQKRRKPLKRFDIRVTEEMFDAVKAAAKEDRRSVSEFIRIVLESAVKENGK
jgi:hypothetical protein